MGKQTAAAKDEAAHEAKRQAFVKEMPDDSKQFLYSYARYHDDLTADGCKASNPIGAITSHGSKL